MLGAGTFVPTPDLQKQPRGHLLSLTGKLQHGKREQTWSHCPGSKSIHAASCLHQGQGCTPTEALRIFRLSKMSHFSEVVN